MRLRTDRPSTACLLLPRLALLPLLLVTAALPARADSIDCSGGIVNTGDTKVDLLAKCGEPTMSESRAAERANYAVDPATGNAQGRKVTANVETWIYDRGETRFIQIVTLESGKVVSVVSGGYGSPRARPAAKALVPVASCDTHRFSIGERTLEVLARCGEPANRETKSVEDTTTVNGGQNQPITVGSITSQVEYWTYNFGPQSFVRKLKFVDGLLTTIHTAGYGY